MSHMIQFTNEALQDLDEIYQFYSDLASKPHDKITNILDSIEYLEQLPSLGKIEPLLVKLNQKHRFILINQY